MLLAPPPTPVVVRIVGEATKEVGVADILLQALGLTGLLLIGSALFGLALGAVFILIRILAPRNPFNGASSDRVTLKLQPF